MNLIDDRISKRLIDHRSSIPMMIFLPSLWMLVQFSIFIYKGKKERKKGEKALIVDECFENRFISMELCAWWIEFLDRKGIVFGGTRRITTCTRGGFRACVRDGSRLTKGLF